MKIAIDRTKRIVLLKWLKQGYINTEDIPEALEGYNYFEELMKSLPDNPDEVIRTVKR